MSWEEIYKHDDGSVTVIASPGMTSGSFKSWEEFREISTINAQPVVAESTIPASKPRFFSKVLGSLISDGES